MFVCTGDGTIRTFKEVGGGSSVPVINKDFSYTGECQVLDDTDDEGVKWRIKFLTSGTFIPLSDMTIDVFLVGGGGSGVSGGTNCAGSNIDGITNTGGGGGGNHITQFSIGLTYTFPAAGKGGSGILVIRNA